MTTYVVLVCFGERSDLRVRPTELLRSSVTRHLWGGEEPRDSKLRMESARVPQINAAGAPQWTNLDIFTQLIVLLEALRELLVAHFLHGRLLLEEAVAHLYERKHRL